MQPTRCNNCAGDAALRVGYQTRGGTQPRVEDLCLRCCAVVLAQMPDKFDMTSGVPIENLHAPEPDDGRLAQASQTPPEPERARHKRLRTRLMDHPCDKCQQNQQALSIHRVQTPFSVPGDSPIFVQHTKQDLCYCCTAAALLDIHTQAQMHLVPVRYGALYSFM